ncbi:hypothetical protein TNCV_2434781 [Trichonephila clavipes]|nr:hypothetical protein TNCV_2434781 [Trichonephila clavipes]
MGGRGLVPEIRFQFCICPVNRKQGLIKNVRASPVHCTLWLTRLYSYADCEYAVGQIRVVDWDSNKFAADSFGRTSQLGGVVDLPLDFCTQDCGLDPGKSRWIFMMQKIDSGHAA